MTDANTKQSLHDQRVSTNNKLSAPRLNRRRRSGYGHVVNFWLTGTVVALRLVQLFLLPLVLLPLNAAWGWILVPLVLKTTPFWSLIHETIHGTLFIRRVWNDRCGRVMAVLYGSPFALLKTGHLLHHRYSRTLRERGEFYDATKTTWAKVAPVYYLRLLGGLYAMEVASVLLALLPASALRRVAHKVDSPDKVAGLLLERIAENRVLRQFRIDAVAIIVVYTGAFTSYGGNFWMLLAALTGQAVVVSLSDNAYHYGSKLDAPLEAMNLQLPRPLEAFALNFNLHDIHHRHPGLHWFELRRKFMIEGSHYHLGWFSAATRQLHGPIKKI
jgi:fatty acid desaturase